MKIQIQSCGNFRRINFFTAIFCFGALTAFGALRPLSGHRPAAIARLAPIGNLSPATNLNLAIGLDLRNKEELNQFLGRLYDPASPDYGHYLTKEQFIERFGPSAADYEKAIAYANAHGLKVTRRYANRMLFDVTGSVTNIEKIFHVQLRTYRNPLENRNFHAPDRVPSVDPEFPILDASGLDNFGRRRMDGGAQQKIENLSGSGPGGLVISSDLRAAYAPGVTLNGAGQTIAILSWGQVFPNDIAQFERVNGLPDVNVQAISVNGFPTTPPDGFSDDAEWALDVQMAMSMAPGATILVYEGSNVDDILNKIADDDIAKQISTSGGYYPASAMLPNIVSEFSAQGQSFYGPSGDGGAYTSDELTNVIYQPTTYPNMTAVGGTVMALAQHGGPWVSETTWNGSGGGWDANFAIPSYQQGISMTANHGSTQYRNLPDISMQAVNLYSIRNNGVLVPTAGTSASAPLMAGFTALVNQQAAANGRPPVGTINAAIYNIGESGQYAAAFHDITIGNNTNSRSPNDFSAVSGYDLCTGWGAPNGTNLINLLAAPTDPLHIAPGFGFAATIPYGGDVSAASTTFTLTNTGGSVIPWSDGSSASWLHVVSTGNNLTSGNSMQMTVELDVNQAKLLSVGTHYAQVMFTNTVTGVVQTRFFTLTVSAAAQPLALSGFNASLVVPTNGTLAQPRAVAFDQIYNYCLYQAGFPGGTRGVPAEGQFVSGCDGRTVFQLGPFDGSNHALLLGHSNPASGTLTLTTPQSLNSLAILASSANGAITSSVGTVVLNFTNGTHSPELNFSAPHWFDSAANVALGGFGRISTTSLSIEDYGDGAPNLFQTTLPLAAMGLTQAIASITFTMPAEATNTAIFAVSSVGGDLSSLLPVITQQPQSVTNTDPAAGVSFNVTATGAPPLNYQWYSNGVPLEYGIMPTLAFDPDVSNNAANYQVVVTNLYGAVTSSVATLTAYRAPVIVQQPFPTNLFLLAGQSISLNASAIGTTPLYFSWRLNGVPIPGATNTNYVLPNAQTVDSGAYSLAVNNAFGTVTSATVAVIVAARNPYSANVLALNPLAYWRLNETSGTTAFDFVGANNGIYTNVVLGRPGYGSTPPVQSNPTELAAQFGPTNSYVSIPTIDLSVPNGGNGEFAIAAWVNASNIISTDAGIVAKGYGGADEQFVLDCGGTDHAFRFFVRDASGNAKVATSSVLPDNQWHWLVGVCDEANSNVTLYVDGTNAAQGTITAGSGIHASAVPASIGARKSSLSQPYDLQFLGAIDDVAIFTNALGASQIASIYQAVTAIGILEEPMPGMTTVVGGSVTNHVTASGSDLTYQWFGPDGAIAGMTNAALSLTNVQSTQAGTYFVTVSNSFGSAQSASSFLYVFPPGVYFQDFSTAAVGATNFSDGSQLFSDHLGSVASVQDDTHRELQLTAAGAGDTASAFELPDLNRGAPVYAFSAKWNSQVYGGFPNAGNGFSFNYGQFAALNLTNGAVESGYSTGLCFSVQTSVTNNPGFYLRVNGNTLASVTNNPSTQWGNYNATRHFFEVDWNYASGLTVRVDGQTVFTNAPTYGFVPHAGDRFVWGARSSDSGEEMRLDNIVVMTGGNLSQISTTSPYYADASVSPSHPVSLAFDGDNGTYWADSATNSYAGATVSLANAIVYSLTSPSTADRSADAKTWLLEGSNNGGTSWSPCGAGTGAFVNSMETRCWMGTNTALFGAYRLNILQNNGASAAAALGELRLYRFNTVALPAAWIKTLPDQPAFTTAVGWGYQSSIASSADGSKWAAVISGGGIYVSTDSGLTWTQTSAPVADWASIASSADGNKLAAVVDGGGIWTSSDSGAHWTQTSASSEYWESIASSSDGNKLAAVTPGWMIVSSDAGAHWSTANAPQQYWSSVVSSSDGSKLAAVDYNEGWIFSSANSGASWIRDANAPARNWNSLAMSADGSRLAAVNFGEIWVSANGGDTWTKANVPGESWASIAASSDGSKLAAAAWMGEIYTSADYGVHWTQNSAPDAEWYSIASSADGNKLAAIADGGGIWTYAAISAAQPQPPVAITKPADQISLFYATLNGQVTPNLLPTAGWFQWGLTADYGNVTPPQNLGTDIINMKATMTGLSPATTYHYRAVALNNFGTNYGADMTFTTRSTNGFFNITLPRDTIISTHTSDYSPSGQEADKAIDGTVSSKYLNFAEFDTGFTVYPTMTNIRVQALGLISAEDEPERDPASFALYGSYDGTDFTLIASNAVPPFASTNSIQSFSFANTNTYAAYKVIFPTVQNPATANSMQIAEVELLPYGDITSTNDALTLSLPNGAYLNGIGPANSLLDKMIGGNADKVVVFNDTTNVVALITPTAGMSIVKGFEFIGGDDDATYPGREPSSITLDGSNDGVTFTNLLSVIPAAPTADMQIQGFSILENTNSCKIYRVTFGPPQSGNTLQIGELRLFGITSTKLNVATKTSNLLLSWPSSDFVLQQSTNLASPDWTPVTNDIIVTNGESRVVVTPAGGNQFFRLGAQ